MYLYQIVVHNVLRLTILFRVGHSCQRHWLEVSLLSPRLYSVLMPKTLVRGQYAQTKIVHAVCSWAMVILSPDQKDCLEFNVCLCQRHCLLVNVLRSRGLFKVFGKFWVFQIYAYSIFSSRTSLLNNSKITVCQCSHGSVVQELQTIIHCTYNVLIEQHILSVPFEICTLMNFYMSTSNCSYFPQKYHTSIVVYWCVYMYCLLQIVGTIFFLVYQW